MNKEWSVGSFVWAKLSSKYWAGIVVHRADVGFLTPKKNCTPIFWFGDYRVSQVPNLKITHFTYDIFVKNRRGSRIPKQWPIGVKEALCIAGTLNTTDLTLENITESHFLFPKNGDLPLFVKNKLQEICDKHKDNDSPMTKTKPYPNLSIEKQFVNFKKGMISALNICLGCYSPATNCEHPIFKGMFCTSCEDNFKKRYYVIGTDETKYFCTVCTFLGEMLVCERQGCGFVYCYTCIDQFASEGAREKILRLSTWICFVCDHNNDLRGTLIVKHNWKDNISNLFKIKNIPTIPLDREKKPIRVLSLFDGIGTAFTVLRNLSIEIDQYYACEIDRDAMDVVEKNYPNRVVQLGNVTTLTEDSIKAIAPIDLLVGGSPCNDLSAANPYRRGLYDPDGTGILFFDYYRVLTSVRACQDDRHLFWLFENVSSMGFEARQTISRFLGCEPRPVDAAWVSAMRRPRLFWGNLPSLHGQDFVDDGPKLQEFLLPGRRAVVDKLQTVTTRNNSLLQGPTFKLPVVSEDGLSDNLDITELEAIFGFPSNYTDVNNLCRTDRQKLLGQAWSVPVVTILLNCLRDYFKT